ncbi:hypothetical protein Nepgr_030525 [Nepenthes gracilis]|uniref:Cell number regulator 8-like n=1 Tax=Nepenthes gracilis TaxID=150966 RepID=A0AAD3TH55_NEPGR|nr:hypothetical protein Nepgr_030525 [Nepenthes gracilis]
MTGNQEESSPLLDNPETIEKNVNVVEEFEKKNNASASPSPPPLPKQSPPPKPTPPPTPPQVSESYGWTVNGLPLGVVGEPVGRMQWNSNLVSCLGRQDEFWDSDLEVCVLGTVAPCVLSGSTAARLGSAPETFTHHCMTYNALYLLGNCLFGWNCLAPWFSYKTRTVLRRQFNLQGNFEALSRTCGCLGSILEDDLQREQCETMCDFATHFFCHPCSLCQEGREVRRRLPHAPFHAQPILVMVPPPELAMDRDAA